MAAVSPQARPEAIPRWLASPAGFEPATFRLEGGCSGPLSYGDVLAAEYRAPFEPPTGRGRHANHVRISMRSCLTRGESCEVVSHARFLASARSTDRGVVAVDRERKAAMLW